MSARANPRDDAQSAYSVERSIARSASAIDSGAPDMQPEPVEAHAEQPAPGGGLEEERREAEDLPLARRRTIPA